MIPRVSIIIPCFNLGGFLDEAVDSALSQTFHDLEVLIVDDGSTDEATRALLAGYDRPRTRVVRTANLGLPSAKNTGIAETRR
jgi:glycosyltransferase involved in cell wall biosynthesis